MRKGKDEALDVLGVDACGLEDKARETSSHDRSCQVADTQVFRIYHQVGMRSVFCQSQRRQS